MGSNISGNAYALTILSPIQDRFTPDEVSFADNVRDILQSWNFETNSPMALVPQTYLCRFFVLDDVYTESLPGASAIDTFIDWLPVVPDKFRHFYWPKEDHLKSRYLVFSCNFHGGPKADLDGYLRGMWNAISDRIKELWCHCYGFDGVDSAEKFIAYMKKCQLEATLFFNGSTDDPLEEQLKALYLKQEFTKFVVDNQGLAATAVKDNFQQFIQRVAPTNLASPTWVAGGYRIDKLVK